MTNHQRPFSQACENNQQPIWAQLQRHFADCRAVLEVGSGTGQHSVYFAPRLAHLHWYTSDVADNHAGILAWQQDYPADNLHPPLQFCIGKDNWPSVEVDGVFSANTCHIMQPDEVRQLFALIAANLPINGVFCLYGPFNINGQFTSDSNARFAEHLAAQGYGKIWDVADLAALQPSLTLLQQIQLPANNQLLVWQKQDNA